MRYHDANIAVTAKLYDNFKRPCKLPGDKVVDKYIRRLDYIKSRAADARLFSYIYSDLISGIELADVNLEDTK